MVYHTHSQNTSTCETKQITVKNISNEKNLVLAQFYHDFLSVEYIVVEGYGRGVLFISSHQEKMERNRKTSGS